MTFAAAELSPSRFDWATYIGRKLAWSKGEEYQRTLHAYSLLNDEGKRVADYASLWLVLDGGKS